MDLRGKRESPRAVMSGSGLGGCEDQSRSILYIQSSRPARRVQHAQQQAMVCIENRISYSFTHRALDVNEDVFEIAPRTACW
jgi:hypothetical protein